MCPHSSLSVKTIINGSHSLAAHVMYIYRFDSGLYKINFLLFSHLIAQRVIDSLDFFQKIVLTYFIYDFVRNRKDNQEVISILEDCITHVSSRNGERESMNIEVAAASTKFRSSYQGYLRSSFSNRG